MWHLSQEYVSLSFSADGKMLLAQGGGPEYNLVLWIWEKSKVAAVAKTTNQQGSPVYHVSKGRTGIGEAGNKNTGKQLEC